jgi:pyruvate formate lyase activating enzyme
MRTSGRVHSIETLGTVDGPGIRTVIFFQGCPLRCQYCHNPDTWEQRSGEERTIAELVQLAQRYIPYYKASGGGVTLSGGEPALQPEFAGELLRALQASGIHTALDTSGFFTPATGEALLECTDLVILDIKHMDPHRFLDLTGREISRTLAFAQQVSDQGVPLWIRQVLIPGWTDDPLQLQSLALYCSSLHSLERLEILPYHRLGVHKWEALGLPYTMAGIHPPTHGDLKQAEQIILNHAPALPLTI